MFWGDFLLFTLLGEGVFILGPVLGLKFRMCFFAPSCILYTFKEFAPWAKLNVCVSMCVCFLGMILENISLGLEYGFQHLHYK